MKAEELRIGNWYNLSEIGGNDPYLITGKDIYEFELDPIDDIYYPIPLTEDWLEIFNGKFIERLNVFQFQTKQGRVVNLHIVKLEDGKIGLYEDGVRCVKLYVHQLQNLYYALTNEELTLND